MLHSRESGRDAHCSRLSKDLFVLTAYCRQKLWIVVTVQNVLQGFSLASIVFVLSHAWSLHVANWVKHVRSLKWTNYVSAFLLHFTVFPDHYCLSFVLYYDTCIATEYKKVNDPFSTFVLILPSVPTCWAFLHDDVVSESTGHQGSLHTYVAVS